MMNSITKISHKKNQVAKTASLELHKFASSHDAKILSRFFKCGQGEYGEGDIFIGVRVPATRKVALVFSSLSFAQIKLLFTSKIHEERLLALLILNLQFSKSVQAKNLSMQKKIFLFYIKHVRFINNWDLIDTSAPQILGNYLFDKDRSLLYQWAQSKNLWHKRIAILSTFYFIKKFDFNDTLHLAEILLHDTHDLIHKAVGWMLREVGNRNLAVEQSFLKKHYTQMPRTMLRYAIEKFPEKERQKYLKGSL